MTKPLIKKHLQSCRSEWKLVQEKASPWLRRGIPDLAYGTSARYSRFGLRDIGTLFPIWPTGIGMRFTVQVVDHWMPGCQWNTVGRRFTYQALRVVLEPISRNRQQHCFKILWSFNFCPSGAVHRWSMVATLGVRRMASPELVIQSPQIRFHFRVFSKKDQIARRREWFSGVSSRAFLWFVSGPSESPDPCSQCCVGMQTLEFSQKLVLQFQHWLQG